jgi:parallel beta-helix repeat protein
VNFKIIAVMLFLFLTVSCVSATTITVGDNSNTNADFTSIQDALNYSQDDDLIVISEGIYSENLVVDKQLKIQSISGEEGDVIISSGDLHLPIIHVISDNVEIRGVTVTGEDERVSSGIFLDDADNCRLINNKITNVTDGILGQHVSDNIIQYNSLSSNVFHGVNLFNSTDNYLEENGIYENERGVYLNNSDRNVLRNNNFYYNSHYGIALLESSNNKIINNTFFLNEFGITLTNSDKNNIISNNASYNKEYGFFLFQADSNYVSNNVLADNKDSGLCLFVFSTNNSITENQFSDNFNGVSITANDNFILNNTFESNDNYGIFHLRSRHENTIEGNIFKDNPSKNIKIEFWKEVALFIFVLLLISSVSIAFKISWLQKGLFVLFVLMVVSVILLIVWYFPFESDLPANNVYVENLEANSSPINDTHSRVTISMNLNYQNKDAYLYNNNTGDMIDNLPVFVQVSASTPADGSYSDEDTELIHEEQVVLEYLGSNYYECTIDLESGKAYPYMVQVKLRRELPYPRPSYGEVKWELLGGLSDNIDLT